MSRPWKPRPPTSRPTPPPRRWRRPCRAPPTLQSAAEQQQQFRERLVACDSRSTQLDQRIADLTQKNAAQQQQQLAAMPTPPAAKEPSRETPGEPEPKPA